MAGFTRPYLWVADARKEYRRRSCQHLARASSVLAFAEALAVAVESVAVLAAEHLEAIQRT